MGWRERAIDLLPEFLLRIFARPYIAGNSLEKAMSVVNELWEKEGFYSILDLLGEGIKNREDAKFEVSEYLRMIERLPGGDKTHLSIKPTQMGIAIDYDFCLENVRRLTRAAGEKGIHITIDMEESKYTDATLRLFNQIRSETELIGAVLQARLFRSERDIEENLKYVPSHVRLCLGIYIEPPEIAYTDKAAIKENYVKLARKLWERGHIVALATHDEKLIRRSLEVAEELKVERERIEIQMLLGVPRLKLQRKLREEGYRVRIYVPYGVTWKDAYAYARRRLRENPNIVLYGLKNLFRLQ